MKSSDKSNRIAIRKSTWISCRSWSTRSSQRGSGLFVFASSKETRNRFTRTRNLKTHISSEVHSERMAQRSDTAWRNSYQHCNPCHKTGESSCLRLNTLLPIRMRFNARRIKFRRTSTNDTHWKIKCRNSNNNSSSIIITIMLIKIIRTIVNLIKATNNSSTNNRRKHSTIMKGTEAIIKIIWKNCRQRISCWKNDCNYSRCQNKSTKKHCSRLLISRNISTLWRVFRISSRRALNKSKPLSIRSRRLPIK